MENTEETKEKEDKKEEESKKENTEKTTEKEQEELKLTGNDIMNFLRKVFRAGNSRKLVWTDEDGKEIFKLNLILVALIVFIVPVIALFAIIFLVLMNHSLSIEKRK